MCPEPEVLEGQSSLKLEGWWLKLSQFHGLIVKRFHCAKRNTKGLFSQILLPAFFVCVAMTVALSVPEIGEILHRDVPVIPLETFCCAAFVILNQDSLPFDPLCNKNRCEAQFA